MTAPTSLTSSMETLDQSARAAAESLTRLLEEHARFSFLRLGDGELRLMLQSQEGEDADPPPVLRASCEIAHGDPGLDHTHAARLLASYERCSFLDDYAQLPYNREGLPKLRWTRSAQSLGEASSGAGGLIFAWVHFEFHDYLARHRCLFCGAEAALLEELLKTEEYRRLAAHYWPQNATAFFFQPRGDGLRLSADLDLIGNDLRAAIREHRVDTIFLSLGGAAKILCHELADELGIRAIDFGSTLRSFTYSGSDGYATWRASHHPHLLRVPFALYLRALRAAHPALAVPALVAKAHAQLCLEVQSKELLHSVTSDVNDGAMFDDSAENLRHFRESMRTYRRELLPLARHDSEARALVREFRRWRWKKGLEWDGRLFRLGVACKGALRQLVRRAPAKIS